MKFKIGDIVSRISHNNDIIFKIISIDNNIAYLKGVDLRLCADALIEDLKKSNIKNEDKTIIERSLKEIDIDREKYFYIPGKILHIDGDSEYLDRCMNYYNNLGIKANGITIKENEMAGKIKSLLIDYKPDILVITGHDAYYSKSNDKDDLNNYQNSFNFINAVRESRNYEHNQDKLIIIAGACQSNFEGLIKSGANFASSPKRINIHALDPAIIASSIAFSDKNQSIDLFKVIDKTKYGFDGVGGLITNGTMYVGYPR